MGRRRVVIQLLTLGAFLLPIATAPPAVAAPAVPNQLIVAFKNNVPQADRAPLLRAVGAKIRRNLAHIRGAAIRPRSGLALAILRRRLEARGDVAYVERDFILQKSATPDDPLFAQQYALASLGTGSVNAQPAWNSRTSCSKIAVLDTGTQNAHPDLKGNVWHNSGEKNNNGKDDDKNGYVDDYYGVNLVKGKGNGADDEGHGTHVSGIIAGHGNNALGIAGLCWTAKVMPVKFMDSHGRGSTSDAIAGIAYAVKQGAKIINCSFGSSSKSKSLQDEVDYAKKKGALLVVAAGNDGNDIDSKPSYPASFSEGNILTVAATTSLNQLASFSNYGHTDVDLGAPGSNILSTYINSQYKTLSGTSMAAPYVAATAAMLRSKDGDLSYSDLKSAIRNHVTGNPALAGKTVSGGQLNVAAALAAVN
jgi:hypothetical protein